MTKKKANSEEVVEQEEVSTESIDEVIEEQEEPKVITKEEVIEQLQNEIKQLKNDMLKQHADLENTKKRLEKERIIERKYAAFNFAKHILTPLDNFDLALSHIVESEETKTLKDGMLMIKKQLDKVLEEEGVSEVGHVEDDYDPNFHQAIMTEKVEGVEANKVVAVLQKGYVFKDRLIRPAMVKISE